MYIVGSYKVVDFRKGKHADHGIIVCDVLWSCESNDHEHTQGVSTIYYILYILYIYFSERSEAD